MSVFFCKCAAVHVCYVWTWQVDQAELDDLRRQVPFLAGGNSLFACSLARKLNTQNCFACSEVLLVRWSLQRRRFLLKYRKRRQRYPQVTRSTICTRHAEFLIGEQHKDAAKQAADARTNAARERAALTEVWSRMR